MRAIELSHLETLRFGLWRGLFQYGLAHFGHTCGGVCCRGNHVCSQRKQISVGSGIVAILDRNIGMAYLEVKKKMSYSDPAHQRAFCRDWTRRRRADWFAGKECAVCGSRTTLELDHIDPSTKVSHRIWSWAPQRFAQEVAKCQVLCSACHRAKTRAAVSTRALAPCGTHAHYRSGCRCVLCRRANAQAEQERRRRLW